MKSLQQYRIPFTGLKPGKHQFEYEIDESFFDEFEYSLVKRGKLNAQLELDKQETMLILNFRIRGEIGLSCDVCLSEYPAAVDITEQQIVKFTEEGLDESTEEIMVLGRNEHEIDVSGLLYEYINLAVPFISRCGDEGNTQFCDKQMIAKLAELSGQNKEEETNEADPRWAALKNIKQ